MAVSCIGLLEFCRMAIPSLKVYTRVVACTGLFLPLAASTGNGSAVAAALVGTLLLLFLLVLFQFDDIKAAASDASTLVLGVVYVPLLLAHLVLLRSTEYGIQWLFLLLVIVMAGDTAAFYVGSTIGKRRLYPEVSPKKSIEGSLGGLIGSVCGALIAHATFFPELAVVDAIIAAIILGLLGQLGDLFESLLKRCYGVKDSGTIIPGHGGILDRLDSIIFAAPVAYYYVSLLWQP